jgi:hypothetical protein
MIVSDHGTCVVKEELDEEGVIPTAVVIMPIRINNSYSPFPVIPLVGRCRVRQGMPRAAKHAIAVAADFRKRNNYKMILKYMSLGLI